MNQTPSNIDLRTISRALLLALAVAFAPWGSPTAFASDVMVERVEALRAGFPVRVIGVPVLARVALSDFYDARGYQRAWRAPHHRQQLIEAVRAAGEDGLDPADYHLDLLSELSTIPLDNLPEELQADLDLLFSDAFLTLASHLRDGKVNPRILRAELTANPRQREIASILDAALAKSTIGTALSELRPAHPDYHRLVRARKGMVKLLDHPWLPIPDGPVIEPGDRDDRMPEVRRRLIALGDLPGYQLASDLREYSGELEVVVPAFQARHGLEPDGIIGGDTVAALNLLPADRVDQIDAALERWRWLPHSLGERYVLINIAGYELKLIDKGTELLRKRVIVGQPYRQTPVFSGRIRYLVLNPTWTVPRKLMIQDYLPHLSYRSGYLERLNMRVYRGWGADRQRVDPATIDWASLSKDNFPYQFVQAPGPNNALGQIKFMFPNPYAVYLHDTPSRDLFRQVDRPFSSGCIRVEQPFALAEKLLSADPRQARERLDEGLNSDRPQTISLPAPVPIYIQYWTAWVDSHGRLHFRGDVYNRDSRLISRLREPPAGTSQSPAPL